MVRSAGCLPVRAETATCALFFHRAFVTYVRALREAAGGLRIYRRV
jgi:hypothetical protein